ncbi:DNA adenine methylase [Nannocystis punicea]|uniref:site-specific DNA-methyltransferase (adenine-specific) n=1 Tax=Nannocystis punicea TaxID=2995304 RepID=A0ABY7H5V1_9BACT|nr:DNA adenine methylase [Nannocystis poenicansa]WAS94661.1 DNA adenine methylase [Nannocystis poenicansa]
MIKYLGSKRLLIPEILRVIRGLPEVRTVIDLFSGTSRVGHALKAAGYRVLSNDHNAYAETLARCYVQADREDVLDDARRLVAELNALPGEPGYVTRTFCEEARFFQPKNGARIDAIRRAIAEKSLPPELEAVLLVALIEAADRVDSTTGVQMAYLKSWAARAHGDLELRVPEVLSRATWGKGQAHRLDALAAAAALEADLAYLDPPYNQHSYLGNYHVWETIVRGDAPEAYGVARKRVDVQERRSPFNARTKIRATMEALVDAVRAPLMVVSFSDEGYLSRPELEALLARRGPVRVLSFDYKRYVGAQIGIYSPRGEKVGRVSHLRNTEMLYVVGEGRHADAVAALPEP